MHHRFQIPLIQSSDVIDKNEDGSDITKDVDVLSFAGLKLSDLSKSLIEGTLETIIWVKLGSPSIPLGRGDLHITHPEICD